MHNGARSAFIIHWLKWPNEKLPCNLFFLLSLCLHASVLSRLGKESGHKNEQIRLNPIIGCFLERRSYSDDAMSISLFFCTPVAIPYTFVFKALGSLTLN